MTRRNAAAYTDAMVYATLASAGRVMLASDLARACAVSKATALRSLVRLADAGAVRRIRKGGVWRGVEATSGMPVDESQACAGVTEQG